MHTNTTLYDCAIIGGGLAGLCLAIQLKQQGHSVVLIEKNSYPLHKVCGEYISMESWDFIQSLGLNLSELNLPIINTLNITAHNGYKVAAPLALGGFGISRYTLDDELATIAKNTGVTVLQNCKATDVVLANEQYTTTTNNGTITSKLVCGSYGKLTPNFIPQHTTKGQYIGVKYHIKTILPIDTISLHNFNDGYCGVSKVDNDTYCVCYLTTVANLRNNNNDIKLMEKNVLMQNPHLHTLFNTATFVFDAPLVISQISFNKKKAYANNVLMLGDAAGAIAPLCGNGMSIGMRASKLLATNINLFLQHKITKVQLVANYSTQWDSNFALRIKVGYYLQQLFGKRLTTLWALTVLNKFPKLLSKVITLTHGKPF